VVKVMEICLIAIIVFHALNGIRITVADFFGGTREQKTMLLFVTLLTVVITVYAAKTFFPF
jgi:succinate dehydrogenase/fumarate reductase cytochrome b subunit